MRELCRVGGAANLGGDAPIRTAGRYGSGCGHWLRSREPFEYRKDIREALVSGYSVFNERIEEVYTAMISFLGFRLRETFTLRQFTVAADALGQGCGLRERV